MEAERKDPYSGGGLPRRLHLKRQVGNRQRKRKELPHKGTEF